VNLERLAHYIPVTSTPNDPIDRTRGLSVATVGTTWGKGSSFEYSASLRFPTDESGLSIHQSITDGELPKKRIILDIDCKVEQDVVTLGAFEFPPGFMTTNVDLIATRIFWQTQHLLPKTYIGQAEPPKRRYNYYFDGINAA